MGPIHCHEISVTNYQPTPQNTPEELKSQLHTTCTTSLKCSTHFDCNSTQCAFNTNAQEDTLASTANYLR